MKKFILHTLIGTLAFIGSAFAQDFPKTYTANPCANCTPPGYTIVSGGPVALSNMTGVGGSPLKNWVNGFSNPPSSFKAIDANVGNVFLTLKSGPLQQDKVKVIDVNVEKGNQYTFHYYVMTSRAHLTSATISDYATSAKLEVTAASQQGLVPVVSKTTSFTPGVNVDTWIEQTVTFVAPESHLHFQLSLVGNPNQVVSYVNFDIYSKPFDCVVPGGQVSLFHGGAQTTPFACATTNLYDLIESTTPAGATPVWGINPNSTYPQLTEEQAKAAGTKPSGQYYYAFYKTPGGCYNTDVSTAKASFTATPTQVSLIANQRAINCINQTSVDLNAQVTPTSYKVHWFTNDSHQGAPIANPQSAPVGDYYAFYFDSKNNCYSVNKAAASAVFSVTGSTMCCNDPSDPSNQIPLLSTDVKIVAPAQTYDLTKLIPSNISLPPNTAIEWYTSADHVGSPIADPQHADPGKYYVFAHDLSNGCFNVPLSKSSVNVSKACNAGTTPVALKNTLGFYCQVGESPMNLNDFVVGGVPAGLSVAWYTNDEHSGNPVSMPAPMDYLPVYYAFFYDNANQCFSPPSQPLNLLSTHVPINCPYEDGCQLSTCSSGSVNLNALHSSAVPNGWELRWYNNSKHIGSPVATPSNVTDAGDYYAFYYNLAKQCYNKSGTLENGLDDLANKKVTVVNGPCAGTQLVIRVALQGVMQTVPSDDIMRTDLQNYFGNSGLLPTTSPYGDGATCPEIGDGSKMATVVDWVKVEIRDAVDPSILLESKSLILWGSGFVGNLDGTSQPTFTSQSKPVRIVVKHRNHLAVMSNPIQDFSSGVVSYDFTTALSQASNAFGDPPQMVQSNGFWCMWMGDIAAGQDLGIDASDITWLYDSNQQAPVDTYTVTDLNMDGGVDASDVSLLYFNNLKASYSSLVNY